MKAPLAGISGNRSQLHRHSRMWYIYLRPDLSGTRGVRGKGERDAGYLRANANHTEGLVKEGRQT